MNGRPDSDPVAELIDRLQHYDRSQLAFQISEIAGERTYLQHGVEVREGDVVLDVGANVGVAAVFFALHCGAGAVHCFEPVGPIVEVLRANVRGLDACVVHPYGLAAVEGAATITFYPGSAAMSGLHADPAEDRALVRTVLLNVGASEREAEDQLAGRWEAQELECELRTLSGFLREQGLERVDLLKVDVEKAELEVLAGIDDEHWPLIRQAVIEVHDVGGRCAEIAAALAASGFDVHTEQEPVMRGTPSKMVYARRP